jgi:hypothetical protein
LGRPVVGQKRVGRQEDAQKRGGGDRKIRRSGVGETGRGAREGRGDWKMRRKGIGTQLEE